MYRKMRSNSFLRFEITDAIIEKIFRNEIQLILRILLFNVI